VILIGYDGSADARSAIESAGELLAGQPAAILSVWDGLTEVLIRTGAGFGADALDVGQLDATAEQAARDRAAEGVALARDAGLSADPRVCERTGSIWQTILDEADAVHASAIVLGSRGLSGLKSLLLGSVSHAVLQHADRPVIVVPSPAMAGRRAAHRR
jgi:nucleotide-binding universal stress UspA family protein